MLPWRDVLLSVLHLVQHVMMRLLQHVPCYSQARRTMMNAAISFCWGMMTICAAFDTDNLTSRLQSLSDSLPVLKALRLRQQTVRLNLRSAALPCPIGPTALFI